MEPQRNLQNLPNLHGTEDCFQSMSPWIMIDDAVLTGFDQNQTIDVNENITNVFSKLHISSANEFLSPVNSDSEIGAPIGGFGSVNRNRREYSGAARTSSLTVDPHQNQQYCYDYNYNYNYPLWRNGNGNGNREIGSCVFDFDQSSNSNSNLLYKEPSLYCKPHVNTSINNVTDGINMVLGKSRNKNRNRDNMEVLSVLSLKELRGMIHSLAKDQNGCRLLQSKFENPTNEEIEFVLFEVLECIADLMKDQFGNYLVQKLISVCNDDHKLRMLLSLTDVPVEMVLVCMNPHGTRAMQKLLENLTDRYQIALAMSALRPGAARLANDPNGHHVIQYCLIHFPSDVNEPILNEIANKCYEVATDRSGCCVLQACIEHSHGKVRNRLVAEILSNAVLLAEDPYGNYVLQHMVGLKVGEFTARLVRQLQGNFASLSCNKYASNVVEKCLNESGEEISTKIVIELITCSNPALLLIDPYANFVIQSALTVSKGYVYDCLLELISDNMASMRTNLYGKKILAWFEKRRILAI